MFDFSVDVEPRSDNDIAEIVRAAVEKYETLGAVPILPLTEREFRRLYRLVDIGIDRAPETHMLEDDND